MDGSTCVVVVQGGDPHLPRELAPERNRGMRSTRALLECRAGRSILRDLRRSNGIEQLPLTRGQGIAHVFDSNARIMKGEAETRKDHGNKMCEVER